MKKLIICLASLAFLFASALYSQQGRGRIRGVVLDEETGQPLPDVTVKMFMPSLSIEFRPSPVTDKEGHWSANFLRTGMWTLEFDKVGYAPQTVSYDVRYPPSTALKEVLEVRLRPIKGLVLKSTVAADTKKAEKLFDEKKYPEAREILEKIIADNPEAYILYKNIGNSYFAEENYERAIEAYMKVYEKDPSRTDVAIAIANSYNNMGKKDAAAEWYKKIPVDDIKDVDTAYNAGVSLYNAGNPGDAIPYFKKSVEINPGFADGYYQLGMASVAMNKADEALDAFKKFLELAPDSPQAATAKSIMEALTRK
jgi:tetratricopeptide (TPR) repeat protein